MRRATALIALSGAAVAQAPFFGRFEREHFAPPPTATAVVRIADVDGDGHGDLLLRSTSGTQMWYRNDGHAVFAAGTLTLADDLTFDTAIADVDQDGDDDLSVQGNLHRNCGNGSFTPDPAALPLDAAGIDLQCSVDLDGDGTPELIARAAPWSPPGLRLFHNDGSGRFVETTAAAFGPQAGQPTSFVVADFDGDGDRDLVVVRIGAATGELLRNDGGGRFGATALAAFANGSPASRVLAAGDLDGDGAADLLVRVPGTVHHFLRNDGTGAFVVAPGAGFEGANTASLADLDGDHRLDVVDGDAGGRWWQNLGGMQFAGRALPPYPWRTAGPGLADLDGDGDLDAVAAGERLRLALGSAGGTFGDGRLPLLVRSRLVNEPSTLRTVSVRTADGPAPAIDVAWHENGNPRAASSRDPAGHWQRGSLHPVSTPPAPPATAVALFADTGPLPSLVVCTGAQPLLWRRADAYTFVDASAALPAYGAPVAVAASDLTGDGRDELVFGGAFAGPQILALTAGGQLQSVPVSLPAATPSASPLFEQVHLGDVDGDGDLDIVHELRVVRNDRGGGWSLGASFAPLVPANASGLCLIDHDGDHDQDLVVWTPTLVQLLENTGSGFVDRTFGHLPLATNGTTGISAGDVDRDGDDDLLLVEAAWIATLLRNDRGVFARFRDVAMPGALVDLDLDGAPDVFDGFTVAANACCRLDAPVLPTPGANWRLHVTTRRTGPAATLAALALATARSWQPLPVHGVVRVDLGGATLSIVPLVASTGMHTLPIPTAPWVLGVRLVGQAIVLDGSGRALLTGAVDEVVR